MLTRTSVELPIAIAGTLAKPISVSTTLASHESRCCGGISFGSERVSRKKRGGRISSAVGGRGCSGIVETSSENSTESIKKMFVFVY